MSNFLYVLTILSMVCLAVGAGSLPVAPADNEATTYATPPAAAPIHLLPTTPAITDVAQLIAPMGGELRLAAAGDCSGGQCGVERTRKVERMRKVEVSETAADDDEGGRRRPAVRAVAGAGKLVRAVLGHDRRVARREARRG